MEIHDRLSNWILRQFFGIFASRPALCRPQKILFPCGSDLSTYEGSKCDDGCLVTGEEAAEKISEFQVTVCIYGPKNHVRVISCKKKRNNIRK